MSNTISIYYIKPAFKMIEKDTWFKWINQTIRQYEADTAMWYFRVLGTGYSIHFQSVGNTTKNFSLINILLKVMIHFLSIPTENVLRMKWHGVKNPPANAGDTRDVSSITGLAGSWSRKWQCAPVFLPGKFHGQRSLVGPSLWGHKNQTQLSTYTYILKIVTSLFLWFALKF